MMTRWLEVLIRAQNVAIIRGNVHFLLDSLGLSGYITYHFQSSTSNVAMVKLIALYRKPTDIDEFDRHFNGVHLPLVRKTPGLRKLEVTRITGAPIGESKYHVMAEMYYDTVDAMNAANASPEGRAVAKDVMSTAADLVTIFFGEIRG
jgi:uncharacterized protein (TIGR02118 family)